MKDLFEREEHFLKRMQIFAESLCKDSAHIKDEIILMASEYERLLRQLRRTIKISDKTTDTLYSDKQDLLNKINTDQLTEIYNRRFLDSNLNRLIKSLSRSRGTLALMMLDIDFFKFYNDFYGHSEGDACLKNVAQAISSCITRESDFIARYGGEEFCVVLPNTDKNGAIVIAERIINCVNELKIPHQKSQVASCVTISIGVISELLDEESSADDMIRKADEALYESKKNGRNQYTFKKAEAKMPVFFSAILT